MQPCNSVAWREIQFVSYAHCVMQKIAMKKYNSLWAAGCARSVENICPIERIAGDVRIRRVRMTFYL